MDFNIEIRKKQLESLDQFLTSSRDKLQSILDSLGWSEDKIEEEKLFVNCPYNVGHKILADKIEEHINRCRVKSSGYDLQENFLSEPNDQPNDGSIKLDTIKKIEVLSQALTQTPYFQTAWNGQDPDPQTYSRLVTTFSRDERLALYDYCVANTKGPLELPEFDTSQVSKNEGNTSYTEEALMSFERDIKRKSVKYKPIHTNNKNYKEVLREVINSQMQQYNDWLGGSNSSKGPHTPEYCCDEEGTEESKNEEKPHELVEGVRSYIGKISNSSSSRTTARRRERTSKHSSNHSRRDERIHHNKEDTPNYSRHSSVQRSSCEDDSQESNNVSKISRSVKSEIIDSSYEHHEDLSRTHSRESSIHSSYKYKQRSEKHRDSYKKHNKSRSHSRDGKTRYHHKRRSRSRHRSKEHKSHRRDKISRDRSRKCDKYRDSD